MHCPPTCSGGKQKAAEEDEGLIQEETFEGLGPPAAVVDEVAEVEENGANTDDELDEEGLYNVNEQLKRLAVASAAVDCLVLLGGRL